MTESSGKAPLQQVSAQLDRVRVGRDAGIAGAVGVGRDAGSAGAIGVGRDSRL